MVKVKEEKKIKFPTTRFGIVEVDEDKIVRFVDEIPGFPKAKRFVLIPHAEDSPFNWLQSIDMPELAFVVTDPWLFFEDYKPIINEGDLEKLEVEGDLEGSLVVLSILTIPDDPYKMTANLKAPVIINSSNNTAKQVILVNEDYSTKHLMLSSS